MPSCATCDRYLAPATVRPDGTCPSCGRPVDVAAGHGAARSERVEEREAFPWHLKLAAAALAIYLGFRAYEGVAWLVDRVF